VHLRHKPLALAAVSAIALAALTGGATCAAPNQPTSPVHTVGEDPKPALHVGVSAAPAVTVPPSASVSAGPSAAPSAAVSALPVRSATPGKVQCGREDCDLSTELCCGDSEIGYCEQKAAKKPQCGLMADQRLCDETADCPKGQRCCQITSADDTCMTSGKTICTPKKCGQTLEVSNEVCLPGSTCASGACIVASGKREGSCPLDANALRCGAATCKVGEACCWDPVRRTGSCAAGDTCPTAGASHRFTCLRPSDCGPGLECFNGSGTVTFSDYHCGRVRCSSTALVAGPMLCESVADCPWVPRAEPNGEIRGYGPRSCQTDKDLPAGVKACSY
jgi:hypothetical protein